jgi:tRNA(fMet)-specific endonuclease VapC
VIILDTDHVNELQNTQGRLYQVLTTRMAASADQDFATTVVTIEEQMRGWLALINRTNDVSGQVSSYDRLNDVVTYFSRWTRLRFDNPSAALFKQLRHQKIRIGTMDLKIASIALATNCTLLSANLRDFQQVPNLHVEDWLH